MNAEARKGMEVSVNRLVLAIQQHISYAYTPEKIAAMSDEAFNNLCRGFWAACACIDTVEADNHGDNITINTNLQDTEKSYDQWTKWQG